MRTHFHRPLFCPAIILAGFGLSGCATGEPDREMIPVEQVLNYSEKADLNRRPPNSAETAANVGPFSKRCQKYREQMETVQTVYMVAAGVGFVSVVVGLLAEDKTVQTIAGLAGVGATLTEVGAATAGNIISNNTETQGCRVLP
jgi:hypothetical protein